MKWFFFLGALLTSSLALASGGANDHSAPVILAIAIILIASKIGGDLASRIGQPAVLGELLIGVLMGNIALLSIPGLDGFRIETFEFIKSNSYVELLANIGVLLLLFEVGLESTVSQMLKVGPTSFFVAVLGIVAPLGLGWGVGTWLLPNMTWHVHLFLGATLCATSVGITARVLQDLNKSKSNEARVILGAAVIDDVLGLIILAVVTGVIAAADNGSALSLINVGAIVGKAFLFLVGSLVIGVAISPRLFKLASRLRSRQVLLATGLAFCFLLSWLASQIELAAIVGAFAAGLVLEDVHFQEFQGRGERSLHELVSPISGFLTPVFFVLMGMRTDLRSFGETGVIALAAALCVVAIIGKQICSLGVFGKSIDRISVGVGMIPRGEVGLIFAGIGLHLTFGGKPVITQALYSAIVIMVIVTTVITPPALKWSLDRKKTPKVATQK